MELKDHECSVNGMGVKWDRKLRILHSKTSIKMYKLEPSFKHEVNNRFPNDFAEKNKSEIWKQVNFGISKLQFNHQKTALQTHQLPCIFHVLLALVLSYNFSHPFNNTSALTIILMQYKYLTLHLCRIWSYEKSSGIFAHFST